MSGPASALQTQTRLEAAAQRLQAGRPDEARAILEALVAVQPTVADAWRLLGAAFMRLGQPAPAETALRRALALDKRQPAAHAALADALVLLGRGTEAERSYRAALALNRRFAPAVRELTLLLSSAGRAAEALQVIGPLFTAAAVADPGLLYAYGVALKAAGRMNEALGVHRQAVESAPQSGVAEHNLAALLGDLGRFEEAEAASRRAFEKGLEAPEARLAHARSLAALGRFEEAEAAFGRAIAQRPLYLEAYRDHAQMIWMLTADAQKAVLALDQALRSAPEAAELRQVKAKVLTFTGDEAGALAELKTAAALRPADPAVQIAVSRAALAAGETSLGLSHARAAERLSPAGDLGAKTALCEAFLACGRAQEAAEAAQEILKAAPTSQPALAYLSTAWRLMGDPRHQALYDYEAFVRPFMIDPPDGWSRLSDYLRDLSEALHAQHRQKAHPFDQSLRRGSQISQVLGRDEPVLKAFPRAVERAIRTYVADLGRGKDPLRAQNQGSYRFQGAWSVKLQPGGGLHVDHIHQEGWLSSAFYVELPGAVEDDQRQGWIKFGQPGVPTDPALGAEHFVKPQAGMLVLFPSYMWHGTTPFEGADPRLTIAFDLASARA